jgi:hypothetical protein
LDAGIGEPHSGDALAGVGGDGFGDGGQRLGAIGGVMAESLDAQQAPVGGEADLPQGGQVGQPFPDGEIVGVIDRGLGPYCLSLFVVLLDCAARRSVVSPIE